MKIYKLTSCSGKDGFAILRPSNSQNIKHIDFLDVWWDDWGSGGSKIGDFIFCYGIIVCKHSVFEDLSSLFVIIKEVPLKYNKTKKELASKSPHRLKWLPKEEIPLCAIFSPQQFDCLPQSTITVNEKGMIKFDGIAELRGDLIFPRERNKGLYFSSEVVSNYDFFTLTNSNHLLCTERVKEFCEKQNYENIVFLEVGDII